MPPKSQGTKKPCIQPDKSYLRSPKLYKIFILYSLMYIFRTPSYDDRDLMSPSVRI